MKRKNAELKTELSENKVADYHIVNGLCEQLTKAKDILRKMIANQPTPSSMYEEADLVSWRKAVKEAEQFIKDSEVEK